MALGGIAKPEHAGKHLTGGDTRGSAAFGHSATHRIAEHGIPQQRRASGGDRDGGSLASRKVGGDRRDSVEVRFAQNAGEPPANPQASRSERFEKQFFKTKICAFWEKNRCTRGSSCKYAHGEHELQATPDLTNTALCREMSETGKCEKPNCPFAHSWETLRATEKFYKTTMCSFFRYGRCRLGQLCRHAHSREELLQAKRHLRIDEEGSNASFDICGGMYERQESAAAATTAGGSGQSVCGEDKGEDLDDDFGSPAFERNVTLPASFVQQTGGSRKRSDLSSRRESWADVTETAKRDTWASKLPLNRQAEGVEEEEDDDVKSGGSDDFDDVDDMWARMQSMPASLGPSRGQPSHHGLGQSQAHHGLGQSQPRKGPVQGLVFAPISGAPPMTRPPPTYVPPHQRQLQQQLQQQQQQMPQQMPMPTMGQQCNGATAAAPMMSQPSQPMSGQQGGCMGGMGSMGGGLSPSNMMFMPGPGMQMNNTAPAPYMGAPMQPACSMPSRTENLPEEDSDEELTLGPAAGTSPMGGPPPMQEDFWCRSTSLPAPSLAQMQQGMQQNQMMQPMLMAVVPMMLMPRGGYYQGPNGVPCMQQTGMSSASNNGSPTGASPNDSGPFGVPCPFMTKEDSFSSANMGFTRQVSAPANCSSELRPKIPQQDLAKALCAQVVGGAPVPEADQRELEANLLRSMMPETYED